MRIGTTFVLGLLLAATALPAEASSLTARASSVLPIHSGPHDWTPIVGKLADQERVRLDACTRRSIWCHVIQLDGGPSGWVDGSYLVGSPAKNAVTPFEFSFDPLWPSRGLVHLHP